ncbi:MAG: hypothetical protein A2201_11765 [Alicyclobacillus sp. RIFOXYA1_FULL_53_8]|nr:MAG: hypothetical protein A2201_11765 [Alicyclobacillus sp. RIFOXYA1_FULL_53_8]
MSPGVAFFLLLIGLLHVFFPKASWYTSIGWKLRDAEPSDTYLTLSRVGGVIASLVAIIALIVSFW